MTPLLKRECKQTGLTVEQGSKSLELVCSFALLFKIKIKEMKSEKLPASNHSRPLSDWNEQLYTIREYQYNPIGVTQMYLQDVFVFETNEEATKAYNELDVDESKVSAFWYGKEDFLKEVKRYESMSENKVLIYWLSD